MNNLNICTICGHQNILEIKQCIQCGSMLLDPITARVSKSHVQAMMRNSSLNGISPPINTVALFIPGRQVPYLLQIKSCRMTIGRRSTTPEHPDIDLLTFQAGAQGVSRNHACLHVNNEGWFIEDLNSTNGTWLNDQPLEPEILYPFASGDSLRFGQFVCSMRFSEYNEEDHGTTGAKEHGLSSL